ncbi:hypothetical protein [Burkholderia territorii]|nr:hypothetical protein [Burkholderia territorii]
MAKAMTRSFVVNVLRKTLARLSDAGPTIVNPANAPAPALSPLHIPGSHLAFTVRGHKVLVAVNRDMEKHPFVKGELLGEVFEPGSRHVECVRIGRRYAYDVAGAIEKCMQWPTLRRMNRREAQEKAREYVAREVQNLEDWCAGRWWFLTVRITVRDTQNKEVASSTLFGIQSYLADDYVTPEVERLLASCMSDVQRGGYPAASWGM